MAYHDDSMDVLVLAMQERVTRTRCSRRVFSVKHLKIVSTLGNGRSQVDTRVIQ